MRDIETIKQIVKDYQALYKYGDKSPLHDYEWGMYNGLEIVLALLEDRPAFYIDQDRKHNSYDLKHYPEYFL